MTVPPGVRAPLLGVDGGGTKTVAWVADEAGNVIGRGVEDRASNIKAVGLSAALMALESAIQKAFAATGRPVRGAEVACLGLAGIDRPEDREVFVEWGESAGLFDRLILVNDGELVLAAGTPEGWGVAVIAGTGSIAVGRSPDGRTARAGGWGHVFGDEGSGYGVAVAALRRVAGRFDGRLPGGTHGDILTSLICSAAGVADPSGLVSTIYGPGFDRSRIAALAGAVVRASKSDPAIVRELLEPAGEGLADAARAVAERLGLAREGLPLAIAGGFVLSSEPVSRALRQGLARSGFATVARRVEEPISGAIVLARREGFGRPVRLLGRRSVMEPSVSLIVDGAVERPLRLAFEDFSAIPDEDQVRDVSGFPSRKEGGAVSFEALLTMARPRPEANYVTLHASRDDFHVSVPLGPIRSEAFLVYRLGDGPLPRERGGPVRFLIRDPSACHTSELDDCANVKYLDRIELTVKKGRDTRPADEAAHSALHASQATNEAG